MNLQGMRRAYHVGRLNDDELPADPFVLLERWLEDAVETQEIEPNAMALATATKEGLPSVRFVLLKGVSHAGIVFFTNYESRKARELDATGHGAAAMWWPQLERQVRAEGAVSRLDPAESDAYFDLRPRGSKLGAWSSPQSEPVASRAELEERAKATSERFAGAEVPRPPFWGGYLLAPNRLEFWQGGGDRLHDRFAYSLDEGGEWVRTRLAP